ncbi:ATP-binding protein [Streptomyces cavernicola]|uniref:ATP-binding protein n=1 Tax=Streptomyces cavernicola TaxID=3043613 RepID=A0ABT6SCK1_9ACTN|nr:ATP-binding protein [Streptomyces sp. B-S-A6]MDI3405921.1 ATP-binding protein [Streptomyces sp. B-S-A6]
MTLGEHSVGHFRRILRTLLTSWGMQELCDAAELALTELLTNVLRHVPENPHCTTEILGYARVLRVEVTDRSTKPLRTRPQEPLTESGRGLLLVEAVTDRWGTCPPSGGGPGKTVWFECETKR